jgi:hypothetical protein
MHEWGRTQTLIEDTLTHGKQGVRHVPSMHVVDRGDMHGVNDSGEIRVNRAHNSVPLPVSQYLLEMRARPSYL